MSNISDIYGAILTTPAAATIAKNDLVSAGPDGAGYTSKYIDGAVNNMAFTATSPVALTTNASTPPTNFRVPVANTYFNGDLMAMDSYGHYYLASCYASSGQGGGLAISKYINNYNSGTTPVLVAFNVIDSVSTNASYGISICMLSSGNLGVAWIDGTTGRCKVGVVDYRTLNLLFSYSFVTANVCNSQYCVPRVIALSGGGFAVVAADGTYSGAYFGIFDNSCNTVLAPITIPLGTATNWYGLVQLSNGNILFGYTSTASSGGYGIYTATGTVVINVGSLASTPFGGSTNDGQPQMAAVPGYFAIACPAASGNKWYIQVYNNAGTLQGSQQTATQGGPSNSSYNCSFLTDGQFFYQVFAATQTTLYYSQFTTAGATNYDSNYITLLSTGLANTFTYAAMSMDASGALCVVYNAASSNVYIAGFNLRVGQAYGYSTLYNGSYSNVVPNYPLSLGDGCFLGYYDYASGSYLQNIWPYKVAPTNILGIAQSAASPGALVPVKTCKAAGQTIAANINQISGSPGKSFDFTGSNLYGNKGVLFNNGVVLRGY